jgi:hypothetical protein
MEAIRRSSVDRKALIREYKERQTERGVFSVRCLPTGEVWVGSSRNLYASRNALLFTLRLGQHRESTLQTAWNTHGERAFQFDVLEVLDEDTPALLLTDRLKGARREWAERLHAHTVL